MQLELGQRVWLDRSVFKAVGLCSPLSETGAFATVSATPNRAGSFLPGENGEDLRPVPEYAFSGTDFLVVVDEPAAVAAMRAERRLVGAPVVWIPGVTTSTARCVR